MIVWRLGIWDTVHIAFSVNKHRRLDLTFSLLVDTHRRYIWWGLMFRLLGHKYTIDWNQLIQVLHDSTLDNISLFMIRYVFQSTIYHIWRERNCWRHDENLQPTSNLKKLFDKNMWNRFSFIRVTDDYQYEEGIRKWFETQSPSPHWTIGQSCEACLALKF